MSRDLGEERRPSVFVGAWFYRGRVTVDGGETALLAESLRQWLSPIRLSGLTAPEATKLVTNRTVGWGRQQGWSVKLEVPGRITRPSRTGEKRARLDLVCTRSTDLPSVAIEIDQNGKVWSLRKLLAEVDAGNVALWVRWHGRTQVTIPSSVGLVDIHHTADWHRRR